MRNDLGRQLFKFGKLDDGSTYEEVLKAEVLSHLKDGYILSSFCVNPRSYCDYTCVYTRTFKKYIAPSVKVFEEIVKADLGFEGVLSSRRRQMEKKGYDLISFSYIAHDSVYELENDWLISIFIYND